jgi:hypothetical protein
MKTFAQTFAHLSSPTLILDNLRRRFKRGNTLPDLATHVS